jgi:hypothetical protein
MAYGWTRRFAVVGLARVIGLLADPEPTELDDEQAIKRFNALLSDLSPSSDWRNEVGAA